MKQCLLALAFVPVLAAQSADTVLYAATDAGVHRSFDFGRTWTKLDGPGLATIAGNYGAGETGVYRLENDRWTRVLDEPRATSVAFDPADPLRVYAAADGRLHTSNDGGRTWTAILTPFPVALVAADPNSSYRLYISATHNYDRTFATTTNRGETWQSYSLRAFPFLTVDASTPGRLYATMGGLIESRDYGMTWRDLGPNSSDLMGVLPDGAHLAQVTRVRAAALERERPGDVHTCIDARWVQYEDPNDPITTTVVASGEVSGWASYIAGLWAAGQLPGNQPCTAVVRVPFEDATFYAAGSRVYRRTGLLTRRVDLVSDLGSPIRSLVVGR